MQILFSRTIAMSDNSKDIYLVLKKSIVPKYLCNDIPGAHTHINSIINLNIKNMLNSVNFFLFLITVFLKININCT